MDIVRSGGVIHKLDRQQHKEMFPQRQLRKATCSMFFPLLAGLISNLIHGDVKPQLRLHPQRCLAAGLCLVLGPLLRDSRSGELYIMSSLCSACYPARPQTQSSVGTGEVDSLYMIWAAAATVVPTGLTGGNAVSHGQAARKYLCDKVIKPSAAHGAHNCSVAPSEQQHKQKL